MSNSFKGSMSPEEYEKLAWECWEQAAREAAEEYGWSYERALGAALTGYDLEEKKEEDENTSD